MSSPQSDVRRRILDATLDLIGEHGVGGVSNRSVARTAGVSLGTLTYHFPSQGELLAQALNLFVDDEIGRLSELTDRVSDAGSLPQAELLHRAQEVIEDQTTRGKQVAQLELYLAATREDLLRESAAARSFRAYDELASAVLRSLGVRDAERVAPLLGALADGLELRRLAVDDLSVSLSEGLEILVAGLTANPESNSKKRKTPPQPT